MPRPATGQTPIRNVRSPDHVWLIAKRIAKVRGETLTDVIDRALRRYIRDHERELPANEPERAAED